MSTRVNLRRAALSAVAMVIVGLAVFTEMPAAHAWTTPHIDNVAPTVFNEGDGVSGTITGSGFEPGIWVILQNTSFAMQVTPASSTSLTFAFAPWAVPAGTYNLWVKINVPGGPDQTPTPFSNTIQITVTAAPKPPGPYFVTSNADPGDGVCDATCTLREAISYANAHPNDGGQPDQIRFSISPVGGSQTINVSASLPSITDPVVIDGLTQTGDTCTGVGPVPIELVGAAGPYNGLTVAAGVTTIRGLAIGGFTGDGSISTGAGIRVTGGQAVIECNRIGTDGSGTEDRPNARGINLQGTSNNTVRWNTIAKNDAATGTGFGVLSQPSAGNRISENSIFGNVGGAPFGTGTSTGPGIISTSLQVPALTYMSAISAGTVTVGGAWARQFSPVVLGDSATFEFFASPTCDPSGSGEGQVYLDSLTTSDAADGNTDGVVRFGPQFGNAKLLSGVPEGSRITITATLETPGPSLGATSGFSRCVDPGLRIDSTDPPSVPVGIGDPAIGLVGAGLDGDIVATVTNGFLQPVAPLSAVSPTSATLTVPSSVLAVPGNFSILLKHADPTLGSSVWFDFFIGPRIDTLSVSSAAAESGAVTVDVTGEGFKNAPLNKTIIRVNGADAVTTYLDPSHLSVIIPASVLVVPGTLQITAFNPNWNAGSNVLPFFVTPAAAPVESIKVVTVVAPLETVVTTTALSGETVEAATNEGTGTIAVANYAAAPGGVTPASFSAANGYFDVYVSPESTFTTTTITYCDPLGGTDLYWSPDGGLTWDPIEPVTPVAAVPPSTCLQFTVGNDPDVHPNVFDLQGTVFAAANGPVIESLAVSPTVAALGTSVAIEATFSDLDLPDDSHTWTVDWGDGTVTAGTVGSGMTSLSDSHPYAAAGAYRVTLRLTEEGGAYDEETYKYVVVYDPSAGFVTGGGWITSPAGAYVVDPSLTGTATFGFVSQYKKGANVPTGNTEFQFNAAGLNFKSTSYDWLVVAGSKAQYKGNGTINGEGSYRFMLTVIDGGKGGVDKFRIRIWDSVNGGLVYDNQVSGPDDADPTTVIGGGSIVVHK